MKVMEVTLNLPDNIYRSFQQLAEKTSRRIDEVITEKIQSEYVPDKELQHLETWSDEDILALANLKLPKAQADRMSKLLDLQQRGTIKSAEKRELEVYTELYQIATLHKAQGCLEAVQRGLIKTPADLK
ncbi:MAG: hypothetical protein K1X72_12495 [Pyrinomonadaceae bacterium]|nr:hypothetical protein [Pyrinomonadaceae bacterium]